MWISKEAIIIGRLRVRLMLSACAALFTSGCVVWSPMHVAPVSGASFHEIRTCEMLAVGQGALWAVVETLIPPQALGQHPHRADYGVTKIDPQSGRVSTTVPVGKNWRAGDISDVAVGLGAIWIVKGRSPWHVYKIDLSSQQIVASVELHHTSDPFPDEQQPMRIGHAAIAVSEEAVWFNGDGQLFRLNPLTAQVTVTVKLDGGARGRPVVTREGSLWVATVRGVVRIDSKTNSVAESIPLARGFPRLSPDAQGGLTVWTWDQSSWTGRSQLSRVDPKTGEVADVVVPGKIIRIIALGESTVWVVYLRERKFWIAEIDAASTLVRRETPSVLDAEAHLEWGPAVRAAVIEDNLWLCIRGKVQRVGSPK